MLVEVKIGALIMDPNSNSPIVVLKGVESENVLPIWVGAYEANAIALEIQKAAPQRPMTHDLFRNLIVELNMTIRKVVISDLSNNTFYARIELSDNENNLHILDSRPSDAIALALRTDCPIFVDQKVFDLSNTPSETDTSDIEIVSDDLVEEENDDWADVIE